jgi:hypothetical protein
MCNNNVIEKSEAIKKRERELFLDSIRCLFFQVFSIDGDYNFRDMFDCVLYDLSDESMDYLFRRMKIDKPEEEGGCNE